MGRLGKLGREKGIEEERRHIGNANFQPEYYL